MKNPFPCILIYLFTHIPFYLFTLLLPYDR